MTHPDEGEIAARSLQTSLLQNATFSALSQVSALSVVRYGNPSGLGGVFELAVASSLTYLVPAVFLDKRDDFLNFHAATVTASVLGVGIGKPSSRIPSR